MLSAGGFGHGSWAIGESVRTPREVYRRTPSFDLVSAAHHEAGHAVAIVQAFRTADWLPHATPRPLVRTIEITEDIPGQWGRHCIGTNVYSIGWPIAPRYLDLMQAQVVIHLAGGVAEAIHRGERRSNEVLAFAQAHCRMDTDLTSAAAVLADLRRLTGVPYDVQPFAMRALSKVQSG